MYVCVCTRACVRVCVENEASTTEIMKVLFSYLELALLG